MHPVNDCIFVRRGTYGVSPNWLSYGDREAGVANATLASSMLSPIPGFHGSQLKPDHVLWVGPVLSSQSLWP
jgi:hypothetical protein